MIRWLRERPSGVRILALVGFVIGVPIYLWKSRHEIGFLYRVLWRALLTGGVV